jgi:hypothetical protein
MPLTVTGQALSVRASPVRGVGTRRAPRSHTHPSTPAGRICPDNTLRRRGPPGQTRRCRSASGESAVFSQDSTWSSGYQGKYTITTGTIAVTLTSSGSHHTFTNREYNDNAPPAPRLASAFR